MASRAEFLEICKQCVPQAGRQGRTYLDEHAQRFWTTYRVCERLIAEGGAMVSVGAGSAYVEHALAQLRRVAVTVIDFPQAIEAHARDYARSHFDVIAHDLTRPIALDNKFDLALSCEIIEHIPQDPQRHIALLSSWLKLGASHIVVTTPNLGNLRNVLRLAFMRPIMPPPSAFFGAVCYENEGVHRREYLPSELTRAFAQSGLTHTRTFFTENGQPHTPKDRIFSLASRVSGRFAQTMILVGEPALSPLESLPAVAASIASRGDASPSTWLTE